MPSDGRAAAGGGGGAVHVDASGARARWLPPTRPVPDCHSARFARTQTIRGKGSGLRLRPPGHGRVALARWLALVDSETIEGQAGVVWWRRPNFGRTAGERPATCTVQLGFAICFYKQK